MGIFPTEVVSRVNSMARLKTENVRIKVGLGVDREKKGERGEGEKEGWRYS